jgi:opacity protein-like surface antigen
MSHIIDKVMMGLICPNCLLEDVQYNYNSFNDGKMGKHGSCTNCNSEFVIWTQTVIVGIEYE